TQTAINTAAQKTAAAIDKVCANVTGATPPCYTLTTGQALTNLITGIVATTSPDSFCGSPRRAVLRNRSGRPLAPHSAVPPPRPGPADCLSRPEVFLPLFPVGRRAC